MNGWQISIHPMRHKGVGLPLLHGQIWLWTPNWGGEWPGLKGFEEGQGMALYPPMPKECYVRGELKALAQYLLCMYRQRRSEVYDLGLLQQQAQPAKEEVS